MSIVAVAKIARRYFVASSLSWMGVPKGLGGNGRSCADCHMPSDNLQLSPASAQARFDLLKWRRKRNPRAQDPLFLPIDADDFRINGEKASDFSNLLENGLVRVTLPLPRTSGSSIP